MRNVFDQYSQPENRVTHALMTALNEDRPLLGRFLKEVLEVEAPCNPKKLSVLEQQLPRTRGIDNEKLERHGIPDGWIFDKKANWYVCIESKVQSDLNPDQIRRHRSTTQYRRFKDAKVFVILSRPNKSEHRNADTVIMWSRVYVWLKKNEKVSTWAKRAADYLEIAELGLVKDKKLEGGALTTFSGFPFDRDSPYSYLLAKAALEKAMEALRSHRGLRGLLCIDRNSVGRTAITGTGADRVWDYIPLSHASDAETDFTKYAHLTLVVGTQSVDALVTMPDKLEGFARRNLEELKESGFVELTARIFKELRPFMRRHEGAVAWCRGIQRRYLPGRRKYILDAEIGFDLRTALDMDSRAALDVDLTTDLGVGGPPKYQPNWIKAAYQSFLEKRKTKSNYQIQFGVVFPYEHCKKLRTLEAIEMIAQAWLGFGPLIKHVTSKK